MRQGETGNDKCSWKKRNVPEWSLEELKVSSVAWSGLFLNRCVIV